MIKSRPIADRGNLDEVGRSYYCFCLEQALANVAQARHLSRRPVSFADHRLSAIENLLREVLGAA